MGQLTLSGPDAAAAFESLMPVDVMDLSVGKQRYGLLLNAQGGVLDDLMFVNRGDDLFVVVNGACKAADLAHIQTHIGQRCVVTPLPDRGLLALQGPQAVTALARLLPEVHQLVFMTGARFEWQGVELFITRSGYTGEDGFEISVPAEHATALAQALLAQPEVKPIGLGARNSLRLEAGMCLYGQDLDTETTPVEASLNWAIQKVRRTGGARAGGFPGAERVLSQLAHGASRLRVGSWPWTVCLCANTPSCKTSKANALAKSPADCSARHSTSPSPWVRCRQNTPRSAPRCRPWYAAKPWPWKCAACLLSPTVITGAKSPFLHHQETP